MRWYIGTDQQGNTAIRQSPAAVHMSILEVQHTKHTFPAEALSSSSSWLEFEFAGDLRYFL